MILNEWVNQILSTGVLSNPIGVCSCLLYTSENIEKETQPTEEMEVSHEDHRETETKPVHEEVRIKQEPGIKSEPPQQNKYSYETKAENNTVSVFCMDGFVIFQY